LGSQTVERKRPVDQGRNTAMSACDGEKLPGEEVGGGNRTWQDPVQKNEKKTFELVSDSFRKAQNQAEGGRDRIGRYVGKSKYKDWGPFRGQSRKGEGRKNSGNTRGKITHAILRISILGRDPSKKGGGDTQSDFHSVRVGRGPLQQYRKRRERSSIQKS